MFEVDRRQYCCYYFAPVGERVLWAVHISQKRQSNVQTSLNCLCSACCLNGCGSAYLWYSIVILFVLPVLWMLSRSGPCGWLTVCIPEWRADSATCKRNSIRTKFCSAINSSNDSSWVAYRGGVVCHLRLSCFCFQIINLRQIQAVFEAFREISGYVYIAASASCARWQFQRSQLFFVPPPPKWGALSEAAVCLSVCLSVCYMPLVRT